MTTTLERNLRDARTRRVLGFLIAKGLLIGEGVAKRGLVKIKLEDALWVARHVEPRVFEVLPAALIHFPKTFLHKDQMAEGLRDVLRAIQAGAEQGPDFEGMRFRDMKKWADRKTRDGRTKPVSEIRVNKTFRLSPAAIRSLESKSRDAGISRTEYLERLILGQPLEATPEQGRTS